ncbi:uncharacterized protein LOC103867603 isoform X2 [Brassica rapa]|uniref:uncharacterized protein LOC103867603 isoform X2 n=1 Tax=Brassica campestris TaxID=3711 RepID=UPI00142E2C7A|nr:uncharacterized protein LOC103867603 isoform X2 [Brassica rapa]
MSTPDPNASVSLAAASETPMTQPSTVKTPSPQPPYRAIAPLHRQPQQSIHPHPFPVRRSNPVSGSPLQDPSALAYPGRGLPTRPGRQSPSTVADLSGGYPTLPVYAYQNGQSLDPMSQFMRAQYPQIQPASHLGSGHLKGVPHFLQPRVAHPPLTSILDNGGRKNSRNDVLVLIRKRKVRITEGASLYSLCRSWLRNGAHEGLQKQQSDTTVTCLPKPLPASDVVETSLPKDSVEEPNCVEEDKEDEESVKQLSDADLLKRHVDRAKKVRARLREERLKRIARYKARLALLLPPFGE